jgi:hypothetical protein
MTMMLPTRFMHQTWIQELRIDGFIGYRATLIERQFAKYLKLKYPNKIIGRPFQTVADSYSKLWEREKDIYLVDVDKVDIIEYGPKG